MTFSFRVWFNHLLRPKVTSVQAIIYENGRQRDLSTYSDLQLASLTKAVNNLWSVEKKSPYWFETDVFEHRRCFKVKSTDMIVHCYTKDMMANGYKSNFAIPIKYRKQMFDKNHIVIPEPIGVKTWPRVEIKFILPHS